MEYSSTINDYQRNIETFRNLVQVKNEYDFQQDQDLPESEEKLIPIEESAKTNEIEV